MIRLVYAHFPCPKCGESTVPLMVWVVPSDYDEDGHSNGDEVEEVRCHQCGVLYDEDGIDSICAKVIHALFHQAECVMGEIGTIYSLFPQT